MANASETRRLKMHANMIFHIIEAQAGTRAKAFLEALMNAVDAGATVFRLTLDCNGYVAIDDGRGFRDIGEIEHLFETLGFPHEANDHRTYGKFGMGRAQLFSFGTTVWRTGGESGVGFLLDVDVKHRGLDYRLERDVPVEPGCRIEGRFYERLRPSEVDGDIREFAELAKYAPIPVLVNDRRVNRDMDKEQWELVTEDAFIRIADRQTLDLYNLGVLVRSFPAWQLGTGGVVVSRRELKVNFARNDVLVTKCEVWKRIRKLLEQQSSDKTRKKGTMNESERAFLARRLLTGEVVLEDLEDSKLVTDIRGRHWPLRKLGNLPRDEFTVAPEAGDRIGEHLHIRKMAFVLSPVTLGRFGVDNGEELIAVLQGVRTRHPAFGQPFQRLSCIAFEDSAKRVKEGYTPLIASDLNPKERLTLRALNQGQQSVKRIFEAIGEAREPRELRAGLSEHAQAWTDGKDTIYVQRDLLKLANQGFAGFASLAGVLAHEYVHDADDACSHRHGPEFYETFEAVCGNPQHNLIAALAEGMFRAYADLLRREGKRLSQRNAADEDRQVQMAPQAA